MTVEIRAKTKPENCKSCSKVMYSTAFTSPQYEGRKRKYLLPSIVEESNRHRLRYSLRGHVDRVYYITVFFLCQVQKNRNASVFILDYEAFAVYLLILPSNQG